jgi:hypothetical protein
MAASGSSSSNRQFTLCPELVCISFRRDNGVRVTVTWRVLRLRMEERPPDMGLAAYITNKLIWTALQEVVLQLGGWLRYLQLLSLKT